MSSYAFLTNTLVDKYGVQAQAIGPEATLTELGLDSLTLTELLFDLEDKFDVEIPEDRATFRTLGEAAALIDGLVRSKPSTG